MNSPACSSPRTAASCWALFAAIFLSFVSAACAANISVVVSATYVGDQFLLNYGLGSPTPSKTVYLYVNGSEVDSVTNTATTYYSYAPPSAGDYTFDVYYSDSVNGPTSPTYNNTAGTYSVSNPPPPTVANDSTTGTIGVAFSYYINGGNYVSNYGASGLPPGLTVNTSSGRIYGTPTSTGVYNVTVSVSNISGSGSGTLTITINPQVAPSITAQPVDESPAAPARVVAGAYATLVLRQDGMIFGCGNDSFGELGDGKATSTETTPVPVAAGLYVSASSNLYQSVAARGDGTVWAWGYNNYGQLGDGTTTEHTTPVRVTGITGATSVSAGLYDSLALKSDGTVWAWGTNNYGQLGNGTMANSYTPIQVSGLTNVIAIASGQTHHLALKSDGTVWAWGANVNGELGDGTTTSRTAPVQVSGLTNVAAIACGQDNSLAVKSDGTVWAWGYNAYGQLGNGGSSQSNTPVQMPGITGAIAVASMDFTSLILKADGTVWGCGDNSYGQLGNGSTTTEYAPVQMSGVSGATAIAAGDGHSVVLKSDGTAWACGDNGNGQLGNGTLTNSLTPIQVIGLGDCVFSVAATGNPVPTYQWQREPVGQTSFSNLTNSSPYNGVTTPQLWIASPTSAMEGDKFRCIVTNVAGSVTSTPAELVIGPPTMSIVGGNNQSAQPGSFNSNPFDLAVWNAAGSEPLVGASVTFSVQSGGGMLATTNSGTPSVYSTIALNTDVDGTVQVYYQQPSTGGVTSQITATSENASTTFTSTSIAPSSPPTTPGWIQAATSTPSSLSFSWATAAPGTGGAPVAGYNIYRNGTLLNTSGPQLSTSYTDTTATAGTAYTYTVRTVDTAGGLSDPVTLNVSAPASSTTGTLEVLTPAP